MRNKSKVYFVKLDELEKVKNILPEFDRPLGVKVHFGEEGNTTFVPADLIKKIADNLAGAVFVETSVLYKSPRRTATGHREVALQHGFDWLPIDFLDGEEGDDCLEVKIDGRQFQSCYLGKNLEKYKSLFVISHFKGHGGTGFGGALKNLAMGLACRRGKLAMHSLIKHSINKDKCIGCGVCASSCPVQAIAFDENKKAYIKQHKCISCSKCISVCPVSAVRIPWGGAGKKDLEERIAEYAFAAQKDKHCFYINFLINITKECDCVDKEMEIITKDIGVLASEDPVAIDQASYDLVSKQCSEFAGNSADNQLQRAEEVGMGSREYELINY